MKQVFFIVLLFCAFTASAQYVVTSEQARNMDKFLKKTKALTFEEATFKDKKSFWLFAQEQNKDFQKYYGKGQYRDIDVDLENAATLYTNAWKRLIEMEEKNSKRTDSVYVSLKQVLLGRDYQDIKDLYIIPAEEYNAYTLPNGSVWLYSSIYLNFTPDEIAFVLAHEYAHNILKHQSVSILQDKKRERRNNIISGLTALAAGATAIYSASASPYADVEGIMNSATDLSLSVDNLLKQNSVLYHFSYSREQEMVSDVMAYYFMKAFGYDTHSAITALEKLYLQSGSVQTSEYDTHPSILDRILLLHYLDNDKSDAKIRKTRMGKVEGFEDEIYN